MGRGGRSSAAVPLVAMSPGQSLFSALETLVHALDVECREIRIPEGRSGLIGLAVDVLTGGDEGREYFEALARSHAVELLREAGAAAGASGEDEQLHARLVAVVTELAGEAHEAQIWRDWYRRDAYASLCERVRELIADKAAELP